MNVSKDTMKTTQEVTLPEAAFLTTRRSSAQPIEIDEVIDIENCFGFDEDDDVAGPCANEKVPEKPKPIEKKIVPKDGLQAVRERLKRFLHRDDSTESTSKKTKPSNDDVPKPAKKQKKLKSPLKENPNVIFGDTYSTKHKDIRTALATKSSDKGKSDKLNENLPAPLFEEFETVQDRRKSYSRPARQYRKRHVSIDSEPEENDDDDEDFDGSGKKQKSKRRKKLVDADPKENEELEEFAKKTNEHFADVEQFELVVE